MPALRQVHRIGRRRVSVLRHRRSIRASALPELSRHRRLDLGRLPEVRGGTRRGGKRSRGRDRTWRHGNGRSGRTQSSFEPRSDLHHAVSSARRFSPVIAADACALSHSLANLGDGRVGVSVRRLRRPTCPGRAVLHPVRDARLMRYVIYGAGGIGGSIGARLFQQGHEVILIARGAHLEALRRDGLRFESPASSVALKIPTAGSPAEAKVSESDVVVLAMKTQDTTDALESLCAVTGSGTAIVCAQNGVENERLALRRFRNVYGMYVIAPGEHLSPGVVRNYFTPVSGLLDVGRYPSGVDEPVDRVARDLASAGFISRAVPDVMRWKYSKLLGNLVNAIEALSGRGDQTRGIAERARSEAVACYAAAKIAFASDDEVRERHAGLPPLGSFGDAVRMGGSSWQSLARGTGSIEADYLNGEIVLLGRMHGIPTPVNEVLQRNAMRAARERARPGSMTIEALEATIAAAS